MGKIVIGTSGYSYNEWVGPFYPPGTKQEEFLPFYASCFPSVELNFSYYKMPAEEQMRRMAETASNLTFSVKAVQTLTHRADPYKWKDEAKTYLSAIEPLRKAERFDAVLFQFPDSFYYEAESRRHLDKLLSEFSGVPSAVEFRNAEWANNRVIEELKKRKVALVYG